MGEHPILIGFADAIAAPETAWSLLESGSPVVAFARRGTRPALRRCRGVKIVEITAPEHDADAAAGELSSLLQRDGEDYRAVMPLDDTAVWLCNQVWQRGVAVEVVGPTGATAELALDKRMQIRAAAEAGFAVPATTHVETMEDLAALSELPLALKPALPVGYRSGRVIRGGGYMCGTRSELERAGRAWNGTEPLLAQPLLAGVGEGLFGLAGPNKLVALSAHRRVRMANPQGSGSSACVSTAVDPELADAAHRMLSKIGWRGMFMLEFLRTADGTAWFMELNGRPWGSMALARRLGLEYPAWAVEQLADPALEPGVVPREGQLCRHLGREIVHLLMVLRGPRSVALTTEWPSRRKAAHDVFRFRRSDRWYNWRRGDTVLFIDDTLRTTLPYLAGGKRR